MKTPLRPPSKSERARLLASVGPRGADAQGFPIGLTDAERLAAQYPGEGPKEVMKPLIPSWLAAVSTALGPVLYLVSNVVPPPWGLILFGLAFVAAALGGLALPVPKFLVGKAVLPAALVPAVASLVPIALGFAQTLQPGYLKQGMELASIVLATLAGIPASVPTAKEPEALVPVPPPGA